MLIAVSERVGKRRGIISIVQWPAFGLTNLLCLRHPAAGGFFLWLGFGCQTFLRIGSRRWRNFCAVILVHVRTASCPGRF